MEGLQLAGLASDPQVSCNQHTSEMSHGHENSDSIVNCLQVRSSSSTAGIPYCFAQHTSVLERSAICLFFCFTFIACPIMVANKLLCVHLKAYKQYSPVKLGVVSSRTYGKAVHPVWFQTFSLRDVLVTACWNWLELNHSQKISFHSHHTLNHLMDRNLLWSVNMPYISCGWCVIRKCDWWDVQAEDFSDDEDALSDLCKQALMRNFCPYIKSRHKEFKKERTMQWVHSHELSCNQDSPAIVSSLSSL